MSRVDEWVEQHPAQCPRGHDWSTPGSFLPGWHTLTGMGHRTWTCVTCNATLHATPGVSLLRPR